MILSHIAHQVRYSIPNPSLSNSALLAHAHLHVPTALLAGLLDLHIPHVLLAHSSALISNPLDVLSARFQQELHNIALVRALGFEHRKVTGLVLGPHVGACAHELLDDGEVAVQGGPVQGCAALGVGAVEVGCDRGGGGVCGGGSGEVGGQNGEEVCSESFVSNCFFGLLACIADCSLLLALLLVISMPNFHVPASPFAAQ
jgi:hypothetical protein